jgi:hypothetical protein
MMAEDRDEKIRRRAHEIWEAEGRPDGKEADHWQRAARELGDGAMAHGNAMGSAAEGSKTERIADDLQSGKSARHR